MRELPFEGRFDALVNWFTSFGYFDDDTNRRVLEGFVAPCVRAVGCCSSWRVAIFCSRACRGTTPRPSWLAERDDDLMINKVTLDTARGRSRTERIVVRGGRVRRQEFSLSQPSASQLAEWLCEAGFDEVELFDESGAAFGRTSRRLVARAMLH